MSIPVIQDLSIVLNAPDHNSTLLTPEFLTGTGIIPTDWELSRPPVISTRASQIVFKNGVTLLAQPGAIIFSQTLPDQGTNDVDIPEIARKYASTLSNLNYQTVDINSKRFVPFEEPDEARQYITETLLAPGSWKGLTNEPVQASINLVYPIKNRQLRLAIAEAKLQRPDDEPVSTVLFAGSFPHLIEGDTPENRLSNLIAAIANWQTDLTAFQKLLDTRFQIPLLKSEKSDRSGVGS
jgi:hypothetical protein